MARLRQIEQDERSQTRDATKLQSAPQQLDSVYDSLEDSSKSIPQLQKSRSNINPVENALRTSKTSGNRQRTLNSRFAGFTGASSMPKSSACLANHHERCPRSQLGCPAVRATPSRSARKNVSYKVESPEVSIVELMDSEWEGDDSDYSGGDAPSENLDLDIGKLQLSPSVERDTSRKPNDDDDFSSDDSSLAILRL